MPRLHKSEQQKQGDLLVAKIKYGMELTGVDGKSLAIAAKISERTLRDRMNSPETFRVRELVAISKKIKIPVERLLSEDLAI